MGCNTRCGANLKSKRAEGKCLNKKSFIQKLLVLMHNIQFRLLHFNSGTFNFDNTPWCAVSILLPTANSEGHIPRDQWLLMTSCQKVQLLLSRVLLHPQWSIAWSSHLRPLLAPPTLQSRSLWAHHYRYICQDIVHRHIGPSKLETDLAVKCNYCERLNRRLGMLLVNNVVGGK